MSNVLLAKGEFVPDPENRFTGLPILVEYIDGNSWRLVREASYRTVAGLLSTVRVPFIFDWASIPWLGRLFLPKAGLPHKPYGIAALFHDWFYRHQQIAGTPITRAQADALFLEIMLYVGIPFVLARVMYRGVRLGGWAPWTVAARRLRKPPTGGSEGPVLENAQKGLSTPRTPETAASLGAAPDAAIAAPLPRNVVDSAYEPRSASLAQALIERFGVILIADGPSAPRLPHCPHYNPLNLGQEWSYP